MGKRQVEELAGLAAVDFEDFYETRRSTRSEPGDLLVLSCDGKGIVMRPDALRTATAKRAARAGPKPKVRLSREDQRNRKRMAEIGAVYDATPAPRATADILLSAAPEGHDPAPGPVAANKWLCASVVKDAGTVIARIFDEAERRDRKHRRTWVALVDGNDHQIQRIKYEAKRRRVKVTIVCDFVHVLQYLWGAANCLHPDNTQAAEQRVHQQAIRVLEGHARKVAGQVRRTATNQRLDSARRKPADDAAGYLTTLAPYLDYPTALANGWPIATGIVEGACRHLIKDRYGHHRRPLGTRRCRGRPEATRPQSQRRLQQLLAISPQPRASPRPRSPLPRPPAPVRHMTSRAPFRRAAPCVEWALYA